jgi:hypothetical protein
MVMALSSDPSAWRRFRGHIVASRPFGWTRKHPVLTVLYGDQRKRFAEWCSVALSTAYALRVRPPKTPPCFPSELQSVATEIPFVRHRSGVFASASTPFRI